MIERVATRTEAAQALRRIAGQGEAPHLEIEDTGEPSHFDRFVEIYKDFEKFKRASISRIIESSSPSQFLRFAAWKYGWWSYKTEKYPETVRVFEGAAAAFPRSDYRPSWLYWAARAHDQLPALVARAVLEGHDAPLRARP